VLRQRHRAQRPGLLCAAAKQKIVAEGPVLAPSLPEEVWERTMRAAAKLAKEVKYVNAGTVEHLFSETPDDIGYPFFLELSPRLQ